MSDTIAIIPARSGSKSITDKNITLLAGHPIIAYSIAVAKLSKSINRVIVSTDSEQYAEIALHYGAEVPFFRPSEYATDSSTDRDFFVHAMQWFDENEKTVPEYWVHLRPTTPLRDPLKIDDAIQTIRKISKATSLRSGYKAPESPFKWFKKDQNGYFKGILFEEAKNEYYNLPKETFEDIFVPDGYVDIVRKSFVLSHDKIHGDRMIGFESPVSTEVDSIEEFEYIKYQIKNNGSILLDFLNQ